jgi:2-keto-4-pentenoate hydratase/2-oxohepta-3-ene-1,7-dioic acid hydratase in catechol pathway
MTTSDEITDPQTLAIKTHLNGQARSILHAHDRPAAAALPLLSLHAPCSLCCNEAIFGMGWVFQTVQDHTTGDMIFTCKQIVSYCSQDTTLLPGTVIITGTPQVRNVNR